MAISDITVNGNTYTDADWRANWEGTISAIANDIAAAIAGAAIAGGTLFKSISGNTTLTSGESGNRLFVFSGTLAANAAVTFNAAFSGIGLIVNSTTGGFSVTVGLASGTTVSVAAGQTALVYCDGTNFANPIGIVATATGAKVTGTFEATGNTTLGGTLSVTGVAAFSSSVTVSGTFTGTGAATLSSTLDVATDLTVGDDLNVAGDAIIVGSLTADTIAVADGITVSGGGVSGVAASFSVATGEIRTAMSAPSGQAVWYSTRTTGFDRWLFGQNVEAQSGSNSGANFDIVAADDAGTPLGTYLRIYRDTGEFYLPFLPTSSAGLRSGSFYNDGGTVKVA